MSDNLTIEYTANEINKRVRVDYSALTSAKQKVMSNKKTNILNEIENKILEGESVIYENQEECSMEIVSKLHNRKIINIMVLALTQSGKTGTMIGLIKNYLNDTTNLIPIENIYIITGLSSTEWTEQTRQRMPASVQERVFHRNDLLKPKFKEDIKSKKDVLVIIDEIQVAAKENQTLNKAFEEIGFYDKQNLLKNDIKIVEFTATPDGTLYDLMKWGENARKIKMEPGDGYTSCFDLMNQGRIHQCKSLHAKDEEILMTYFKEIQECMKDFTEPMYHLIRTPNATNSDKVVNNFKNYFGDEMPCIRYDNHSEVYDINVVLSKKPEQDTFIFIKEKLRCAKTLEKKYLGIVYERHTKNPSDAVIVQGLVGRLTGYDDNGKSVCFTNIPSIEKYQRLWESNFEDQSIKWKSNTTIIRNNVLISKSTFNNASLIDGMEYSSDEQDIEHEPTIRKFTDFNDARKYVKEDLGNQRGPNNPYKRINSDGFYECTVRGIRKVWSTSEMWVERKCNIRNGAGYGFRYCYRDINDSSTLEFWIIHY